MKTDAMGEFSNRVYSIVAAIPAGAVMTYGQIARLLGNPKWARRVGQVLSNTPDHLHIPCHRVVNSKGELAPSYAFSGEGEQFRILAKEGVSFKADGTVDLERSMLR